MTTNNSWGWLFALSVVASGLVAGCSSDDQSATGASGFAEGPMSAQMGDGGVSIAAPRKGGWYGTFGGPQLCTSTGEHLVINKVEYVYRNVPDQPPKTLIRTVTGGDGPPIMPIGSMLGRWSHYRGERRNRPGSASEVKGFLVTRPCERLPKSFDELVTEAHTGPKGAFISATRVLYSDGDKSYVLTIRWNYILCGTAIEPFEGTDFCPDSH